MTHYIAQVHNLILYKMEKGELKLESKEALKCILQEYEIHIKVIEQQLEMCKEDHVELRAEISRLVDENRDLNQQLTACSVYAKDSGAQNKNIFSDSSEIVDNLQQQLALALEEKETVEGLWKSCLKEIDNLGEKLRYSQSGEQLTMTQRKLDDLQKDYTEVIKILESKLSVFQKENDQLTVKTKLLEDQLIQINNQMGHLTEKNASLNTSLEEATRHNQDWKSRYLMLESKFIELDRSYHADKVKFAHTNEYERLETHLKEKVEEALRERDEMQAALERCHERVAELLRNAGSDRSRVEEAVLLVEGAMQDRDQALTREAVSSEEVKKLRNDLNTLVEEAGLRVAQETSAVTKLFENQLTSLKDKLHLVEQERTRKIVEVEQLQQECERLQILVDQSQKQRGADNADRHLESLYQELHFTETECLQLRTEIEVLRESLSKLQQRSRKNSRAKVKLKHELMSAQQQSEMYQQELALSTQRAELLGSQLHQANLQLAQWQSDTLVPRDNAVNTIELYRRLDKSYGQMNDKWRNEMNELTEKFENKLKKLKSQSFNAAQNEGNSNRKNDK